MDRSRPIVCAVDADDQAPQLIAVARALAHEVGCDLRVAHVISPMTVDATRGEDLERWLRLLLPPRSAASRTEEDPQLAQHVVDAEAMLLRLNVLAGERRVLRGDAAREIQALATTVDASMLVVGTRRRGSLKSALLGSVSRELLRVAPCPVMVVPRSADATLAGQAILCGIDDDGRAERAVSVAARLAEVLRRPLVLAHVTQRVAAAAAAAPHAAASLAVEQLSAAAAVEAAELLADARRHVRQRLDVTLMLRQGRTVDELAALARELHAGAIVVATRAPGPVSAAVRGSVGQELTTRSHCPVVVVASLTG